jgi:hypothetical protein
MTSGSSKAKKGSVDSSPDPDPNCSHEVYEILQEFQTSERRRCTGCGTEWWEGANDLCEHIAYEDGSVVYDDGAHRLQHRTCSDCGHTWDVPLDRSDFALAPPYGEHPVIKAYNALVYSVGGVLHHVVVEQGVTVIAEDGHLRISHPTPVHGIVALRPVHLDMPAGEEQSVEPHAEEPEG